MLIASYAVAVSIKVRCISRLTPAHVAITSGACLFAITEMNFCRSWLRSGRSRDSLTRCRLRSRLLLSLPNFSRGNRCLFLLFILLSVSLGLLGAFFFFLLGFF